MKESRPFFPPSSRILVGVVIIAASAMLTYGKTRSVQGPIETLAWFTANGSPGDSIAYASAVYHAAHASNSYRGRWGPTGYMTLGVAGVVFGALLALSALRRPRGTAATTSPGSAP
jgi:ABC-type multidrug transport system permease subunit